MEYIGIDVHHRESQVCIVDERGQVLIERRVRTRRERLAELLGPRARVRVLLEASTESEWVAHALEGLGHEVIVADPNFAPMYATRSRRVKTDRRDARTLADAWSAEGVPPRASGPRPRSARCGPAHRRSWRSARSDQRRLTDSGAV